jgi:MarR family 2-MHQ and catechol resistance regulon transcriptional repressor
MPTHYKGTIKQELALSTFIRFTRAASSLENRLFQQDIIGDLTESQFGVLETLHHLGPQCQSTVSSKLLKSSGNITLVVDNLEKRGFIKRVKNEEDRRVTMIHLTDQGEKLIKEIFPNMVSAITNEMAILTSEEQEMFGNLCKKFGKRSDS